MLQFQQHSHFPSKLIKLCIKIRFSNIKKKKRIKLVETKYSNGTKHKSCHRWHAWLSLWFSKNEWWQFYQQTQAEVNTTYGNPKYETPDSGIRKANFEIKEFIEITRIKSLNAWQSRKQSLAISRVTAREWWFHDSWKLER